MKKMKYREYGTCDVVARASQDAALAEVVRLRGSSLLQTGWKRHF